MAAFYLAWLIIVASFSPLSSPRLFLTGTKSLSMFIISSSTQGAPLTMISSSSSTTPPPMPEVWCSSLFQSASPSCPPMCSMRDYCLCARLAVVVEVSSMLSIEWSTPPRSTLSPSSQRPAPPTWFEPAAVTSSRYTSLYKSRGDTES